MVTEQIDNTNCLQASYVIILEVTAAITCKDC